MDDIDALKMLISQWILGRVVARTSALKRVATFGLVSQWILGRVVALTTYAELNGTMMRSLNGSSAESSR